MATVADISQRYPELSFFGICILTSSIVAFPQSWTIELRGLDDLEDGGNDQGEDVPEDNKKASGAYQEFLQFLGLGCSGSPIQGYPTIVIILSTIPSSVCLISPRSLQV